MMDGSIRIMSPLFVDIDIEYDLDMTLFPGWNDPLTRLQPTLLLHTKGCCCQQNKNYCDGDDGLQNLIDSCVDLECSESDSFVDEILGDSDDCSSYPTTPYADEDFSNTCTPYSPGTKGRHLEEILSGIAPLSDIVTPDLTSSLLNITEQTTYDTTLSNTNRERKGVKRRLFSYEDENNNIPPAKRQHVLTCENNYVFSIIDDLFNHIPVRG